MKSKQTATEMMLDGVLWHVEKEDQVSLDRVAYKYATGLGSDLYSKMLKIHESSHDSEFHPDRWMMWLRHQISKRFPSSKRELVDEIVQYWWMIYWPRALIKQVQES